MVRVTEDRKIFLNSDELGTLDDSNILISRLLNLFAVRTDQRAYKIGMEQRIDLPEGERIEKQIYFQAHPALKEEEVSKLLEEIKETGADPVVALSREDYEQRFGWLFEPEKYGWSPPGFKRLAGRRKVISGGILNGKALSLPKPLYPASARAAHLSGTVVVRITIDETGKVISARAVSGPAQFRAAAVDAARQATFAPTLLVGEPVNVTGVISYTFVGR
jgi:TonB family protein